MSEIPPIRLSAGAAELVDDYLRMSLPATRMLFKYVRFVLTR